MSKGPYIRAKQGVTLVGFVALLGGLLFFQNCGKIPPQSTVEDSSDLSVITEQEMALEQKKRCGYCMSMAYQTTSVLLTDNIIDLIGRGNVTTTKTANGDTLLHIAAHAGLAGLVKRIIDSIEEAALKAAVNAKNGANENNATPLHKAAQKSYEHPDEQILNIVNYLLDAGAAPNAKDKDGRTPLHTHILPLTVVQILLDQKANPNLKDNNGQTALHWLAHGKDEEVVRMLLDNDADPTITDKHGLNPRQLVEKTAFSLNQEEAYAPIVTILSEAEQK